jgi:hypothetical protein
VEDQSQGGAPAAQRGRTTLTVIFARRFDARRGRTARSALAGAATGVRDGGARLRACAGLTAWRQRPAPVRCRARGGGPACRCKRRVPLPPPPGRRASRSSPRFPLPVIRAQARELCRGWPPGAPKGRALEDYREESCNNPAHSTGSYLGRVSVVM